MRSRSALALLTCVVVEVVAYFVVLVTRSRREPVGCGDYCWSDWDLALGWGYLVVAPLAAGQLLFGGLVIVLAARQGNRGISVGLVAFVSSTALMAALLYGFYILQST
jgi:hypothetical protein